MVEFWSGAKKVLLGDVTKKVIYSWKKKKEQRGLCKKKLWVLFPESGFIKKDQRNTTVNKHMEKAEVNMRFALVIPAYLARCPNFFKQSCLIVQSI